ncbi:MAG: hypothetical protein WB611_26870 [Stellaceae bacterium]
MPKKAAVVHARFPRVFERTGAKRELPIPSGEKVAFNTRPHR